MRICLHLDEDHEKGNKLGLGDVGGRQAEKLEFKNKTKGNKRSAQNKKECAGPFVRHLSVSSML